MLTFNLENFDNILQSENSKPVMVEFWAPWCGYCQRLSAAYAEVAEEYQEELVIGNLNIDEALELAERYQVEIIPTIIIFERGKLSRRIINPPHKTAIEAFIKGNMASPEPEGIAAFKEESKEADEPVLAEAAPDMPIYEFALEKPKGELLKLATLKGKVLLIVNTATGCGFTPQYKQLEEMYAKYHKQGLEIIDIPCNQFNGQAPGTDEEIHQFCTVKYGTSFPQMKKSEVNGPNALALYKYLKSQKGFAGFGTSLKGIAMAAMMLVKDPNYKNNPDIKWNFTKFLVDRGGNVVARFEPTADMKDVVKAVEQVL